MTKQFLTPLVVGVLFAVSGCSDSDPLSSLPSDGPLFEQVPADGNGNKEVIPVDLEIPDVVTCEGGATLSVHVVGWIQIREVSQPFVGTTFHLVFTYSNAAGETFVWRNIDSDHFYIDENGDLIDALTGRSGLTGFIGHIVININTGEVEFLAGKEVFAEDLACAALT